MKVLLVVVLFCAAIAAISADPLSPDEKGVDENYNVWFEGGQKPGHGSGKDDDDEDDDGYRTTTSRPRKTYRRTKPTTVRTSKKYKTKTTTTTTTTPTTTTTTPTTTTSSTSRRTYKPKTTTTPHHGAYTTGEEEDGGDEDYDSKTTRKPYNTKTPKPTPTKTVAPPTEAPNHACGVYIPSDKDYTEEQHEQDGEGEHGAYGQHEDIIAVRIFFENYESVYSCGCLHMHVEVCDYDAVTIEARDKHLIASIQTYVEDGVLYIFPVNLTPAQTSQITIVIKVNSHSKKLAITAGTSSVINVDATKHVAKEYEVLFHVLGGGQISGHLFVKSLTSIIDSSGNIALIGGAACATVRVTGSGNVDAGAFETEKTTVDINGSAALFVFAKELIDGKVNGGCLIRYRSSPIPVINVEEVDGSDIRYIPKIVKETS